MRLAPLGAVGLRFDCFNFCFKEQNRIVSNRSVGSNVFQGRIPVWSEISTYTSQVQPGILQTCRGTAEAQYNLEILADNRFDSTGETRLRDGGRHQMYNSEPHTELFGYQSEAMVTGKVFVQLSEIVQFHR